MMKLYLLQTDQLNNPDIFAREYEKMPLYRKEKIDRFRSVKDQKLSLGAGILLRKGLLDVGKNPEQVQILFGEKGKPCLAEDEKLFFSLSHSGSYAMAAFSDQKIGCDVEIMDDVNMKIAQRFFSAREAATLEKLTDVDNKKEMFFRFWTLKESYLKLTGKGLTVELNSFVINMGESITAEVSGRKQPVYFEEYEWNGYRAAICREVSILSENVDKPVLQAVTLEE